MSSYIERNVETDSVITFEDGEGYNTPIVAYVNSNRKDIEFYSLTLEKKFVYNSWIYLNRFNPLEINDIKNKIAIINNDYVYYLSNNTVQNNDFILIHKSINSFTNEEFFLYKVIHK